ARRLSWVGGGLAVLHTSGGGPAVATFCVYSGDVHPRLHAFPTRRSSDLTDRIGLPYVHQENDFVDFDREPLIPKLLSTEVDEVRSEEHTSELQSRFDLVCRLLLEKKKSAPTVASICPIGPFTSASSP